MIARPVCPGIGRMSMPRTAEFGTELRLRPPSRRPTLRVGRPSAGWAMRSKSYSDSRIAARAALSTALSPSCGIEAWAVRPLNRSRIQITPRWPSLGPRSVGSPTTSAPTRPRLPGTLTISRAPEQPVSSPAVSTSSIPARRRRSRAIARAATTIAATPLFISDEPRPYSRSPSVSPAKGSCRQNCLAQRDDVDMAGETYRRCIGIRAGDPGDEVGPTGCKVDHARGKAGLLQHAGQDADRARLTAGRVDRVLPQQQPREGGGLGSEGHACSSIQVCEGRT